MLLLSRNFDSSEVGDLLEIIDLYSEVNFELVLHWEVVLLDKNRLKN